MGVPTVNGAAVKLENTVGEVEKIYILILHEYKIEMK